MAKPNAYELTEVTPTPSSRNSNTTPTNGVDEHEESVPRLHAESYLIVFAVCLIHFAQLINVVGAGAYARDISTVIGGSEKTIWLSSTVVIATVVLSPPVSQAADCFGRRPFLVWLTLCGCIGSVIVARASNMTMAIAGEMIAGLSYGAQPLLHAVVSEVLPRRVRPLAQGALNGAAALAALPALLAGGAMTRGNPGGFRSYFYMTSGVYLLASILAFVLYRPPLRHSQLGLSTSEKLQRLDWIGYALLTSGLVLFCVGLSYYQNPYEWRDVHVLAPFLIGLVLISCLGIYEWKFTSTGMFHHGPFHGAAPRNFVLALVCVFVEGLVFFAANTYFPYSVSIFWDSDPVRIGARYGITFIFYFIGALLGGAFCARRKMLRFPATGAFLLFFTFFVCMAASGKESSTAVWAYPLFLGLGLGVCLCALVMAAQLSTPRELIAITSGLMVGMRSLGGAVGLAVFGAIFNGQMSANVAPQVAAKVLPLGLPLEELGSFVQGLMGGNQSALMGLANVNEAVVAAGLHGLFGAYELGFRFVWVAAGCFTVVAVACSFFLIDPVKEFNMHIDAPAEKGEELYGRGLN